ncbi:hypothetical protein E4U54_003650 [Claviceps lovelessii]|nr:hypothetical protein E4U54_003650 [Claviceps lovelessii]
MFYPDTAPLPAGVTSDVAQPDETLRTINYVTQALTMVIVTAFVATRIYAKSRILGGGISLDDFSLYGGGLNMWEIPKENIQEFFKTCYAATIFYMPMALAVKLALLLITIRVFGKVHRKTLAAIYCLIAILCGYYGSGLFVKIFVCWPISAYWRGESEKCLNHGAIIIADSVVSVVSDLVILLLPVPLTWSLQLPLKKRLRVIGMLCAGGIATAFSIYRLHLILTELKSANQSVVFEKVILSGNAEAAIGLICACLPAVNTLYLSKANGSSYLFNDSAYLKQSSRSRRTASQGGEIVLTRSFHVDTSSLSNCETHSAAHDDLEMESRESRQHSQSELHYKYGHSRMST